ncbi:uncharacterized protein LOC110113178 [Dendrobium catenatum]|uniref:uncharacterized protein LOC110113178 n=1 Tax=Dendrobium catenatum TaxID=906689 RepID=UPI0009F57E01|nr:uncharacterized protein LOC110113178 [Dendrobium catenatum]
MNCEPARVSSLRRRLLQTFPRSPPPARSEDPLVMDTTFNFDTVWSRGVWFLLGKPFVLQKWHPKFIPKKEEFSSVPIWVKIHDLPLACWNSEGISRIASKISVSVAADKLTEQKFRLTYARICVLVDNKATYPEEIQVSLDGDVVSLKVQYEWRPLPCEYCKSLMHFSASCMEKPKTDSDELEKNKTVNRGRSHSRNARSRNKSRSQNFSRPPPTNVVHQAPLSNAAQSTNHNNVNISNALGHPLHFQPHSPTSQNPHINLDNFGGEMPSSDLPINEDVIVSGIPNLNFPNEAFSSSSTSLNTKSPAKTKDIISPNKFEVLNIEEVNSQHTEDLEGVDGKLDLSISGKSIMPEKNKQTQSSAASKKPARGKQNKKPQSHPNS